MRGLAVFARFRRSARDERGAVLVIVAIVLPFVLFGFAALAIDIGTFSQQQRQAQAAADAAALAGAQDLPASATTAIADAKSYVTKNMPTVPATYTVTPTACPSPITPGVCIQTPYNSNSKQIQVTVTLTVNSLFGHVFGITSTKVSATAVAGNTASTLCATPGNSCYAIFAKDTDCTSGHNSVSIVGGGDTITGGILSNGNVSAVGGGFVFGPSWFGPSTSTPACSWTTVGFGNTFASGPTTHAITANWPIDYATDFPSCSGASCTGPNGTPRFCTMASNATTVSLTPASGNIYCAVGSGTAATPSTWNGAISIVGSGGSLEATYVGGSVTVVGGGYTLTACGYASSGYTASGCNAAVPTPPTGNYPLMYATGASSSAISLVGGGSNFIGDVFAPNGTISLTGGGGTISFLEGNDVNYTGGGLTGDGPSDNGTGSSTTGLAALVQ